MTENELIEMYSPLVRKIAGGFQRKLPRNVLREDLIAAGMSGLWDAIRKHDGNAEGFEWYVRTRIRGAILDELRTQDWLPRRARAAATAHAGTDAYTPPPSVVRLDDVSEWEQNRCLADNSQEDKLMHSREAQILLGVLDQMSDIDRLVLEEHYIKGVKFKDLAKKLGVSDPRVSQIHTRALERAKALLAS